jgi:hypothetical protein
VTANPYIISLTGKLLKIARRLPLLAPIASSLLFRLHVYRLHWNDQTRFAQKVFARNEPTVLNGPFRGMKLPSLLGFGSMTSKWLGTYESELHPIIEQLANNNYDHFVDVGAADGYYAIGIARLCFPKVVYAYDTDFISRRQVAAVASKNGPVNCVISSECKHEDLSRICRKKTFILCDIEGAELDLLDQHRVPELTCADMCIEVHSTALLQPAEVLDVLSQRFAETHQINVIKQSSKKLHLVSSDILQLLGESESRRALNEHRGDSMEWLWLKSKLG